MTNTSNTYSRGEKNIKNSQIFLVLKKEFGNFIRGENTLMPNKSCFMYLDVCKLCSNLMEKVVALKKNSLFGITYN